jgi:hypothetical protein
MRKRIMIAIAAGCALTALSLFYGHSGFHGVYYGAPFAFLQTGISPSLENTHTIDFKALILDIIAFSIPAFFLLELFMTRNRHRAISEP